MQNSTTSSATAQTKNNHAHPAARWADINGPQAIMTVLKERGWKKEDLVPLIGSSGGVHDVLAGRKAIGPKLGRRLSKWLNIPFHVLRRCGE